MALRYDVRMSTSVVGRALEWLGGSWLVWLAMVSCSAGASPGAARDEPPEAETGGTLAATGGAVTEIIGGRPAVGGVTSSPGTGSRSAPAATGGGSYVPPAMAQPMPGADYDAFEVACDIKQEIGSALTYYYAVHDMPGATLQQRARVIAFVTSGGTETIAGRQFQGAVSPVYLVEGGVAVNCSVDAQARATFLVSKP